MFGLFKKNKKTEELQESTIENLLINSIIQTGINMDYSELDEKEFVVEEEFFIKTPNETFKYYKIDSNLYIKNTDSETVEFMKEIKDPESFVQNFDENFFGLLEINENEVFIEQGKEKLQSDERQFSLEKDYDWIKSNTFYRYYDGFESYINDESVEYRYFIYKDSKKANFVSSITNGQGDTRFFISINIPKYNIKDIIG